MNVNYIIISSKQYEELVSLGYIKAKKKSFLKRVMSFIKKIK